MYAAKIKSKYKLHQVARVVGVRQSVLRHLKYLDLGNLCPIDTLHVIHMGVVKRFLVEAGFALGKHGFQAFKNFVIGKKVRTYGYIFFSTRMLSCFCFNPSC